MRTVGAFEAKTHLSALLDKVEKQGEEILITKHGKPIAKIVPIITVDTRHKRNIINQLLTFNQYNKLNNIDWKELRNAGRK